jgi:alanine racemase
MVVRDPPGMIEPVTTNRERTDPESASGFPVAPSARPVWAEIDVGAVRHNAAVLARLASPAALCAVVKADGYGHGAVAVGRAALEGGARWLAVAMVEEGVELRDAGIDAPVLVLSEPPLAAMDEVVGRRLTPAVYTRAGVQAAADASRRAGTVTDVHVKANTGMHRVGADGADVLDVVSAVSASPALRFGALWTHFPVADGVEEEDREFTEAQLARLAGIRVGLEAAGTPAPLLHAANSAATAAYPAARLDLVRCGIALYGVVPAPAMAAVWEAALARAGAPALRPVLSLHARVTLVRRLDEAERPSYGRLAPLAQPSYVATVPLGYADGVPRRYFSAGGTVLIGGTRRPLAGMVTMDQIVVDCALDDGVSVGDHVVLIGDQGAGSLTASEWADALDTIAHEVLCAIGPRVPRIVVGDESGP